MTTNQETAIQVRTETVLSNFKDVQGMAMAFIKSGFFENMKEASQAIVKIQAGRELGLSPVYAMQHINMIKGRLTTDANCMALLVKSSGKYDYRIKKHDESQCSITFYQSGKEVGDSIFTIEDAKRAGLVKPDSGWVKYPRAMLFSRAISQGARLYCPDAIGGVYTHEEIQASIPEYTESPEDENSEKGAEAKVIPEPPDTTDKKENGEARKPHHDPEALKSIQEAQKACFLDFGVQPKDFLAELNVDSINDITITPADCYRKIAKVRQ